MNFPKTFVIILNWNGRDDTLECLESVFKSDYPNFEVIVVDNGSKDGSVAAIKNAYPHIHLIENGENLGYAGGNNVGIRYALKKEADYIFLLNNDTVLADDLIGALVEAAESHREGGVFGPVVYDALSRSTIVTAGERFLDDNLAIENISCGQKEPPEPSKCYPVDWVTGAAFFLRRSAVEKVGVFDERFFLVYEESDWCFRARREGFESLIVPGARIWHRVAASFGGEASSLRLYFSNRNRLLFAEKNLSKIAWARILASSSRRLLPRLPRSKGRGKATPKHLYWALRDTAANWHSPPQRAIRQAYRDYVLRRFGDCPQWIRTSVSAGAP